MAGVGRANLTCQTGDGQLKGVSVATRLEGWPAEDQMRLAANIAQRFVNDAWTFDAFGTPDNPVTALQDVAAEWGTPHLVKSLKDVRTGAVWQQLAAMGGAFEGPGMGYMRSEPVIEAEHSESAFQVLVAYKITASAGQRKTHDWYGDDSLMYLNMVADGDTWKVDGAKLRELPPSMIEDHGASFS
ncbi:hypothetical protein [Isoptericola sp. NPDC055881]